MSDRELLEKLFAFLKARTFVIGDEATVKDMVLRYQQPPMTMVNRVAMQMTWGEYQRLGQLLIQINDHLSPTGGTHEPDAAGNISIVDFSDLSSDIPTQQ